MKTKLKSTAYLLVAGMLLLLTIGTQFAASAEALHTPDSNESQGLGFGVMPPHPDLLERAKRGELDLPAVITDPELQRAMGINQPGELIQPSGTWRAIALLVQFTDNPAATAATYFDTLLFANSAGTMRDYYQEVSYGILDVVTVNLPSSIGWMTMPQTYSYYVAGNYGFGAYPQNAQRLAEDAVWAADPVVDYSQYDNDGDGFVESLFVIHAGPGAEFTGNLNDIWSHKWSMVNDPFVDGVTLNNYTMEPEYWAAPGDMTIGVYAHELAHAFGLPDLYDTDGSSAGIGRWALMAGGSWNGTLGDTPAWFSAWSRAFLGFVTPTNVVSNMAAVSIPAAETSQTVYRLWTDGTMGNEYFLVENRQQTGYDSALPGSGLMIWHIDDGKSGNQQECNQLNNWNCGANHQLVALEQADGLFNLENGTNSGDTGDPFPGSTNNLNFDFGTVPNSSSYAHSNDTCVGVNNIGPSGATMTVDLNVTCGLPSGSVALISDQSELVAIAPILDSMGLTYGLLNNNWNGSQGIYTSDPAVLANYDVVVWYASGNSFGRLTTAEEQAALEAYLQAGGRLLVTGYDTIGSPTDPLLADLIRSSSSGDGPFTYDFIITDGSHPITNGPYGNLPTGTPLFAEHSDHDQAEADIGRGAVTVAELSDGHDKIMATELPSDGIVVYWNGNRDTADWTGTPARFQEPGSAQQIDPDNIPPGANYDGSTPIWTAPQPAQIDPADIPPEANYSGSTPIWNTPPALLPRLQESKAALASESVVFPATGDTIVVASDPYWWHAGDYAEGVRTLSLSSVTRVDLDLTITDNVLNGSGHVDLDLSINGIVVGSFTVLPGETLKSVSYTFPAISGPNYTIRLEETNTVDSGAGSIIIPLDTSSMTFYETSTSPYFPATGDVVSVASAPFWWHAGDYAEGVRTPGFSSVTGVNYDLVITDNVLNGSGHVDFDLSINGIVVGSFTVLPGETLKSVSYTFPAISGPNYTIRLEETNTVDPGAGSIVIPLDMSPITFSTGSIEENVVMLKNTLHWLSQVVADQPEIDLLTPSFDFVVPAGGTDSDNLLFDNIGTGDLNWSANWYTGAVDVIDDWTVYFDWGCTGFPGSAVVTFHPDNTFTASDGSSGTWTLVDNYLVFTFPNGTEYSGYVAGDHIAGTSFSPSIGTGCWEAERVISPIVSLVSAERTLSGRLAEEPGAVTEFISSAAEHEAVPGAPWLDVSPASGVLPPGSGQNSLVSVDANVYVPGEYGLIVLHSDDSDEALLAIPVTLEVTSPAATLWIDPPLADVPVGGEVTVDVVISDVVDLYGLAVELNFDPTFVEVVDADGGTAGVQITPGSCPSPDFVVQNTADNSTGVINYDVSSLSPSPPCSGTGLVASITFRGLVEGISPVHFFDWLLSDTNGIEIPVSTQDGELNVIVAMGTLDGVVQMQGRSLHDSAEVCAWDGAVMVDCVFTDPAGYYSMMLLEGSYDVTVEMDRYLDSEKAGVSVVSGSTTTLSTLTLKGGDANDDDIVNILDLSFMGARYLCALGDPCYDAKADINDDDIINILDIVLAGGNYLETSPVPWP